MITQDATPLQHLMRDLQQRQQGLGEQLQQYTKSFQTKLEALNVSLRSAGNTTSGQSATESKRKCLLLSRAFI